MKKLYLSIICLFLIGIQMSFAGQVSPQFAQKFALDYISPMAEGITVKDIQCVSENNIPLYYVINFEPQGWALISAQDAVTPVLGYNLTGSFKADASMTNLSGWLEHYKVQIADAVKYGDKPVKGWESPSRPLTRASVDVEPLIQVHWNQGKPYYNYCPVDNDGKRSVVGCVAVGMAQAMTVAQWPKKPSGSHSYVHSRLGTIFIDYDSESPYVWSKMFPGENEDKDQIARFLYQCGVSVDMDYSSGGSGTQSSKVAKALVNYFGYSSKTIRFIPKSRYPNVEDWKDLIIAELSEGRAVVYSGTDTKGQYGHCFNVDGCDGRDMYHVNWGWGGTGDGYFRIDDLRDIQMNMHYDTGHDVVIGIRQPRTAPIGIILSNDKVSAGKPVGTPLITVQVDSEVNDETYRLDISGQYNPLTKQYKQVPFSFNANGEIVSTEVLTEGKTYKVIITATSSKNEELEEDFTLTVVSAAGIETPETTVTAEEFYSLNGVLAGTDASALKPGVYIVVKHLSDGTVLRNKTVLK